jgi:hypothetical protein
MDAGGKGGKGRDRGRTGKPDKPRKHVRQDKTTGRWWVEDPHTGHEKLKPPGWTPDEPKKMTDTEGPGIVPTILITIIGIGMAIAGAAMRPQPRTAGEAPFMVAPSGDPDDYDI